tara:strand:+ start:5423 stop:5704 length:282 start_codon:yes stop_codon:yes gene_type:complete
MKNKHEWHDNAEDGERVYYRAILHAGRWEFSSARKSDPAWEKHEILPIEKMEALRDVMWNKHLRRRVPLKHVDYIDKLIEDLRESQPDPEIED